MMRALLLLPICCLLFGCNPQSKQPSDSESAAGTPKAPDIKRSLVRINSTQQDWNPWQPWEKNPPTQRSALAAVIAHHQVITTAELVANATYIEFESSDGTRIIPAKVIAKDYEANLALLGPKDADQAGGFFAGTEPLGLAEPPAIGDSLQIVQLESSGVALTTTGTLQSVELSPGILPNQNFLSYKVKASMQSAASSYSLPVIAAGRLAGVLMSYEGNDQICDVISTDIVGRFLKEAADDSYEGFPSLGIRAAFTEDPSFRQWLHLSEDQGGLYVQSVLKGGSADIAGIQPGDVILKADGMPINRRGYYVDPHYGNLPWAHLIRGAKAVGDSLRLDLWRDGKPSQLNVTLTRQDERKALVPSHLFDQQPNYLLKGGLLFQELSRPVLEAYGKDWMSRAPLNLLDAFENPHAYQDKMNRVVFLSGVIPTPATVGYERLRNLIVTKVNGKEIKDMQSLIDAFKSNLGELHSIEFMDEHLAVYLDDRVSSAVDKQIKQHGIGSLSHVE